MFDVTCDDQAGNLRKLSLRADQVNVKNLSKLSRIIPDTMYLLSEDDGHVSLPDPESGRFDGLACFRTWRVSGMLPSIIDKGASSTPPQQILQRKWKPKYHPATGSHMPSSPSDQQVRHIYMVVW